VPAPPSSLSATASDASVALTWTPSSSATSYNLKRATTSGGPYFTISAPSSPSYSDTSLSNGTTYYYVVSAVNSAGESADSAQVSATPVAPAVAPAAPTNLAATAGNSQASLSWTASSGATSYHVKRATTSGGPYTQVAAPTAASYTDTVLSNGTTYYYVVSAVNAAGESANSAQVSATPIAPVTVPAAPSSLAATAGNAQASLSWSASSGATSYHVKRATSSGGPYTQAAAPTSASYIDTALSNGTAYYYVVSAVNSVGESANSAQVSATPVAPAMAPAAPTNPAATAGNAQVSFSWTASSGATSYHVKRATISGGPYTQVAAPSSVSYTDTSLSNGTTYYYVVSAVNSAGESPNSAQVSATPIAPVTVPAAPGNLAATAGNAQISLSWTASSGATSYHVKRATTSGGPYTQVAAPSSASYTDTSLSNGTTYYYVVSAVNSAGESANSAQVSATPTASVAAVTVTVTPSATHTISPYIYGVNNANNSGVFPTGTASAVPGGLAFDRLGGNRLTAYNWETNASNAGSDFLYENDGLFSGTTPASAVTDFILDDQSAGLASLFTVQMQGLVAGDESGPVSIANPPDLSRFKTIVFQKGAAFTATPPTNDANVYMDEFVWAVDQHYSGQGIFGTAPSSQHVFVSLDNEPELWNGTHLEIQGAVAVSSTTYVAKTISLATALKTQFPNLVIFGPAHYGFLGLYSWNSELAATPSGNNWFSDKYLAALKTASTSFGKPLVDVYDFHWYPEATDGSNRVTSLNGPSLTDAQVQAIVQSPRSLWDPSYQENSWIPSVLGGPIYILPRLQAKIAAENPGMKLAITEYYNGGALHIAGTIAQADNLGVFGAQGLFAANLWPLVTDEPYLLAGFRAFRNFDGASHNFGDTSVQATSSNAGNVAAYVSTDTARPGRVVIVAINRSTTPQTTAITGQPLSGTAHLFQMTAASAAGQSVVQPVATGTQAVSGSSLTLTLPSLSVTSIDIY
jgi:fibronectin type 3 domain-containing protein